MPEIVQLQVHHTKQLRIMSMLCSVHTRKLSIVRLSPSHPQVEHHLFPAISFMHYPAIAAIVADECKKRGIPYAHYATLPEILVNFVNYMRNVGAAEQEPSSKHVPQLARL